MKKVADVVWGKIYDSYLIDLDDFKTFINDFDLDPTQEVKTKNSLGQQTNIPLCKIPFSIGEYEGIIITFEFIDAYVTYFFPAGVKRRCPASIKRI